MANAWKGMTKVNQALFPQFESLKHGRLARIYNIYHDYKEVFKSALMYLKDHPVKSLIQVSGLGALSYVWRNNPDELSFTEHLTENSNKLLMVSDLIRNKESNRQVRQTLAYHTEGRLERKSFGFFSLILLSNLGQECDTYEKHCVYAQPRWTNITERIVDVGILGRWIYLEHAMIDYDINDDEFLNTANTESGTELQPTKSNSRS